jgi:hypothetical protein
MKQQISRSIILALAMILIAAAFNPVRPVGEMPALAQDGEPGVSPAIPGLAPSVYISPTMSYQGKLVESGSPVTGNRLMTFRLFTASGGGAAIWTEGPKTVSVSNGLFTVTLGDTTPLNMNNFPQQLYLEIVVAGTVLPRQVLQGAPYALSLAPGAIVTGNSTQNVFSASNLGSGNAISAISSSGNGTYSLSAANHGVHAQGLGGGLAGSALYAESLNSTNGVAMHGYNDSADATLALSNDGTGDLLKGFGGDGGEDEFRFKNDGTFQDKAPSYIFVSGTEAMLHPPTTDMELLPVWGNEPCVDVNRSTTGGGGGGVTFGVVMPAVLYGQPVKVEEVRIYYHTTKARSFISWTRVYLSAETGGVINMVIDDTNQDSTTYTSYAIVPDNHQVLSATEGILSVAMGLYFADPSDSIYLCGLRFKLRHHPLY